MTPDPKPETSDAAFCFVLLLKRCWLCCHQHVTWHVVLQSGSGSRPGCFMINCCDCQCRRSAFVPNDGMIANFQPSGCQNCWLDEIVLQKWNEGRYIIDSPQHFNNEWDFFFLFSFWVMIAPWFIYKVWCSHQYTSSHSDDVASGCIKLQLKNSWIGWINESSKS